MKLITFGFILVLNFLLTAQEQKKVDSLISILFKSRDVEKVNTYNKLSSLHLGSNTNSSKSYAEEAAKLAQRIGYKRGIADANRYLGLNAYNQAYFTEALSCYHKSLSYYEDIDDQNGVADLYNNIAIILDDQKQYDSANEYYLKALNIYEQLNNKPGISAIVMNLGVTYFNKGDYKKALEYYNRSLALDKQLNDIEGIANCYNNIGEIHLRQKQFSSAISFYESSLHLMRKTNNKLGVVLCLINLGDACNQIYDFSRAQKYAIESLSLATQLNSKDDIRLSYENLSDALAGIGDFKKAYYYHKLYKEVSDSIFNETNIKNLHELHQKYEHEKMRQQVLLQNSKIKKKELELEHQTTIKFAFVTGSVLLLCFIFLLARSFEHKRKSNILLTEQNEEILKQKQSLQQTAEMLSEANATKDKLFSIIAHDLRSPFTSLMGYSQLLIDDTDGLDKKEIKEFAGSINYSAKIVYNLLENLLIWSRLQNGRINFVPTVFDCQQLAGETIELFQVMALEKKIHLLNSVYPGFNIYADKTMIETILRNLVSNALKFTSENGSVEIIAQQNENDVIISVDDNGIGITQDVLIKLFNGSENVSTFGTNKEQGTGLGLMICKEFVERHGGGIWVESQPGKGSKFSFIIPCQNLD